MTTRALFLRGKMRPAFSGNNEFWEKMYPLLIQKGVAVAGVMGFEYPGAPRREVVGGIPYFRGRHLKAHDYIRDLVYWLDVTFYMFRRRKEFDILFDCLVANDSGRLAIFSAKLLGKGVVVESTLQGSDDPAAIKRRKLNWLRLGLLRRADAHISISSAITQSYGFTLPGVPLVEINRACDCEVYCPLPPEKKRQARQLVGLPEDRKVVCFVGSVTHRKGIDILIEAWRVVVEAMKDKVLLVCVGPVDFPDEQGEDFSDRRKFAADIQRQVEEQGLGRSVVFTGRTQSVPQYLGASDLFVFPSRAEGMPNSLIEAMASGLPCIASPLNGTTQAMLGDAGLIIDSESPADFARAILRLLRDEEEAQRLGREARRVAIDRYSLATRVDRYIEVFNQVMRRARS